MRYRHLSPEMGINQRASGEGGCQCHCNIAQCARHALEGIIYIPARFHDQIISFAEVVIKLFVCNLVPCMPPQSARTVHIM